MSKHEIRLRRQRLTSRGTDRFRNYGAVLQQHEQDRRLKKIVKAFALFLIILSLIVLIIIVVSVEKMAEEKQQHTSYILNDPRINGRCGCP